MNKKTIRRSLFLILSGFLLLSLWLFRARIVKRKEALASTPFSTVETVQEPILPLPQTLPLDEKKVALGEKLFHDPILSKDNTISCSSCHNLKTGGVDLTERSVGIQGKTGDINSPTVFNSGFNFKQFWDGRAETLEDQVDGPTHNPKEMGSDWNEITGKLSKSKEYVKEFDEIYQEGIIPKNIRDAIATFERSLYTPNSRFDQYLRGAPSALGEDEKKGYQIFKSYGCISCHQGMNAGGNMFQTFGVMRDYFADRGKVTPADYGRFNVTGDEFDRYTFKVPSLRLVALTPPYFHDGTAKTLEEAVTIMGRYQLGRELTKEEIRLIILFLKTLVGEYKGKPLLEKESEWE